MLKPRPEVESMRAYVPGKSAAAVQRELGLERIAKLSQNENALGPSPKAIAAATAALAGASVYPEGPAPALQAALARVWGVEPDWIMVGNGSDEVCRLITQAYLRAGDPVIIPTPSFDEYRTATELMGGEGCYVPLKDGAMDLPAMAGLGREKSARISFVCRPNNPTGGIFPEAEFEAFMQATSAGTLVVLDEAYQEYDDSGFNSRPFLDRYPNLVVLRTFSKLYGLAGLRVGYGVGRPDVWMPLRTARDPFSVNVVAQAAAVAALEDTEHFAATVAMTRHGIAWLNDALVNLPVTVHPSAANFVLIDVHRPAQPVFDALLRQGAIVRPGTTFGLPTCLRVTVGTQADLEHFVQALRVALAADA